MIAVRPPKTSRQVLVHHKNGETIVFIFSAKQRIELSMALGRLATNPESAFDWSDAVLVLDALAGRQEARAA